MDYIAGSGYAALIATGTIIVAFVGERFAWASGDGLIVLDACLVRDRRGRFERSGSGRRHRALSA